MTTWWAGKHLHDFINTTPAQIIEITYTKDDSTVGYKILYNENPLSSYPLQKDGDWIKDFTVIRYQEISHWIKRFATPEEIEKELLKRNIKKYNL